MTDDSDVLEFVKRSPVKGIAARDKENIADDAEEDSCAAFGFLRGIRDRALAIEFRYADGNSDWFAYSCLISWRFNPSLGLLLKFTADVVTLVLIRGSNLDALVNGTVNLPHGIQRHRIMWVREMDETEARKLAGDGPTVDRIEIVEFESQAEMRQGIVKFAPHFLSDWKSG